jgi:hypothetical protein
LPSTEIGYGCNFESLLGISANSMKVLGIYAIFPFINGTYKI